MIELKPIRGLIATTLLCLLVSDFLIIQTNARYLPTRSQDDRLERLRELLKDLFESELERRPSVSSGNGMGLDIEAPPSPSRNIFKREAPGVFFPGQPGDGNGVMRRSVQFST